MITDVQSTSIEVGEIPQWNRLTLDEYNEEFIDEFKYKVSDESTRS